MEISDRGYKTLWVDSAPYPSALRTRVLDAQKLGTRLSTREWLELDRDLGAWYGAVMSKIIAKKKVKPLVIANHGQTVAHFPAASRQGTTLQMGDSSRIAFETGLTVVSHFRNGDIAAGGEGAPLLPRFHRLLAQKLDPKNEGVAIHNIGGISNLTYVSPRGREVLAFDTGPGNLWIDHAASRFSRGALKMDAGGKLARSGQVNTRALQVLLKHPFLKKPAPKSTGRDDFTLEMFEEVIGNFNEDAIATAVAVTVESIAEAYERFIHSKKKRLARIYIAGGGAKNLFLVEQLQKRLSDVRVLTLDEAGIDSQMVEAQGFALFGWLALRGEAVGGAWTGVKDFAPPAHIIPGKNWKKVLKNLS